LRRVNAFRFIAQTVSLLRFGRYPLLQSYPKSGSTWFKQIWASAITETGTQQREEVDLRIPLLRPTQRPNGLVFGYRTHDPLRRQDTHDLKLVVLWRNPIDVAHSYHAQLLADRPHLRTKYSDLGQYVTDFCEGRIPDGYGRWDANLRSWLSSHTSPLLLSYERMQRDPVTTMQLALRHLGEDLSADQVSRAVAANDRRVHGSLPEPDGYAERAGRPFVSLNAPPGRADFRQQFSEVIQHAFSTTCELASSIEANQWR